MADFNSLGRCGTIIVSFTVVSIIIVIALQSATLHLYRTEQNKDSTVPDSASIKLPLQDYLRQTFPGKFFTDTEIEEMARSFANQTSAALNISIPEVFTPLCVGDYCRVITGVIHTCCCKADTGFIAPSIAVDIKGESRTLAQFQGNRQYFYTESCT